MTAIDSSYNYSSRVVALQLLRGQSAGTPSDNDRGAASTFVRSGAAAAAKSASDAAAAGGGKHREVLAFLSFIGFQASSKDVTKSLRDVFKDPALQDEFNDKVKEETVKARDERHAMIVPDQARHFALVDVIMAHRDMFPPDEFSFTTSYSGYTGPGTESATIPSVSDMAAQIFKGQVDQKQADYDASVAAKSAKPDKDGAKLDAMEQAVSTLTMNGQAPVDQGVVDAQAAYSILTQKIYSDDGDLTTSAAAPTAGPERNTPSASSGSE